MEVRLLWDRLDVCALHHWTWDCSNLKVPIEITLCLPCHLTLTSQKAFQWCPRASLIMPLIRCSYLQSTSHQVHIYKTQFCLHVAVAGVPSYRTAGPSSHPCQASQHAAHPVFGLVDEVGKVNCGKPDIKLCKCQCVFLLTGSRINTVQRAMHNYCINFQLYLIISIYLYKPFLISINPLFNKKKCIYQTKIFSYIRN